MQSVVLLLCSALPCCETIAQSVPLQNILTCCIAIRWCYSGLLHCQQYRKPTIAPLHGNAAGQDGLQGSTLCDRFGSVNSVVPNIAMSGLVKPRCSRCSTVWQQNKTKEEHFNTPFWAKLHFETGQELLSNNE